MWIAKQSLSRTENGEIGWYVQRNSGRPIWTDGAPSVCHREDALLIAAAPDLYAAVKVLTLTPAIREWLVANDPKALEQAEFALAKAEGRA